MDTSLHIALCDSDPGDRKQMERLLGRESDKRLHTTGGFYVDTFGSAGSLIAAPMVYDVYFLDAIDEVCDSYEIAKALREKGILSPIVYCISKIDYHNSGELLPNSVFMNKPIKVAELALVLDEIIAQKKDNYIPTIELRSNYETFYVEGRNVLYFVGDGYSVDVHMKDGTIKTATAFMSSLWSDLYSFPDFQIISKTTIVNTRYAAKVGLFSVTMLDSTKHSITHRFKKRLRYKVAKNREEQ